MYDLFSVLGMSKSHYPKLPVLPVVIAVITEGDILHTVIWGKERGKQGLLTKY